MMKKILPALCLLVSMVLTGCYGHRSIGYLQESTKYNGIPQYDSVAYEPYRIRVNDEVMYRLISLDQSLSTVLMKNNDMSGNGQYANTYRVYPDGTIDIPFLRPVHVAGLTEHEAQDTLREAFREIIPDAEVKLSLGTKYFTVLGDAHSGRYYIYKDRLTIFQAMAMTGDIQLSGDRRHIRIIRPRDNGEEPEILEFDLRANSIIDSKYYYIYPNDVIYVARTKESFFRVYSYSAFTGLVTSSVALLTTVLNYVSGITKAVQK